MRMVEVTGFEPVEAFFEMIDITAFPSCVIMLEVKLEVKLLRFFLVESSLIYRCDRKLLCCLVCFLGDNM